MNHHLCEISGQVAADAHAVVILDGASWHNSHGLVVPSNITLLYGLPGLPRCGRVIRQAYHVWGIGDASILFSQRTGGGGAAAPGTARERACLPAGSDDREPARGDGA